MASSRSLPAHACGALTFLRPVLRMSCAAGTRRPLASGILILVRTITVVALQASPIVLVDGSKLVGTLSFTRDARGQDTVQR